MAAVASGRVLIDAFASDLAFQAGQALETLLLDRAAAVAKSSGSPIVTAEHLLTGIDENIIHQLRSQLHERAERAQYEAA